MGQDQLAWLDIESRKQRDAKEKRLETENLQLKVVVNDLVIALEKAKKSLVEILTAESQPLPER